MYLSFFGLSNPPFSLAPDPETVYLSMQHREAIAALAYAILNRKGFMVLTGDAGMGKTTVLARVLKVLPRDRVQSSIIFHPTLTVNEFLELALLNFGVQSVPDSKAKRLTLLQDLLMKAHRENRIPALIVDEAHQLSQELLEEIRLLGNFDFNAEKLLQIVMLGQSELDEKLDRHDLRQFKQRITVRLSLDPLIPEDVERYIRFRWIKAAGTESLPFTRDALREISDWARGVPRLVNTICDNGLLLAFAEGSRTVGVKHIHDACSDLKLQPSDAALAIAARALPAASPTPAAARTETFREASRAIETSPTPQEAPTLLPHASLRAVDSHKQTEKPSFLAKWAVKLGLANQAN